MGGVIAAIAAIDARGEVQQSDGFAVQMLAVAILIAVVALVGLKVAKMIWPEDK